MCRLKTIVQLKLSRSRKARLYRGSARNTREFITLSPLGYIIAAYSVSLILFYGAAVCFGPHPLETLVEYW